MAKIENLFAKNNLPRVILAGLMLVTSFGKDSNNYKQDCYRYTGKYREIKSDRFRFIRSFSHCIKEGINPEVFSCPEISDLRLPSRISGAEEIVINGRLIKCTITEIFPN